MRLLRRNYGRTCRQSLLEPCWGEAQNLKDREILEFLGVSEGVETEKRDATAKLADNRTYDSEMR